MTFTETESTAVELACAAIALLRAKNKRLRAALTYYAEGHSQNPNEGPWGMASTDFGQLAREALKETKP